MVLRSCCLNSVRFPKDCFQRGEQSELLECPAVFNPGGEGGGTPHLGGACRKKPRRGSRWDLGWNTTGGFFVFVYSAALGVSWGMWDLVPRPEIEPGALALGVQSPSHCTTREVPGILFVT